MSSAPVPSEFGHLVSDPSFWDEEEIAALHDRFVPQQARYAAARSPFYRRLFEREGIAPDSIRRAADLGRIPCTTKEQVVEFNDDFLAVARDEVVDVCMSSGTSGRPTCFYQSAHDLQRLAHNEAESFRAAGLKRGDVVLLCCTIDRCFMAGMAYFMGLAKLGARCIRAGAGNPRAQWELIDRLRPNAIVGVPSLLREMALQRAADGREPRAANIERIVGIGEPARSRDLSPSPLAAELAELWGAKVLSTYASTEMATAFCECEAARGGHLLPELMYVEIIGDDGAPLPPGEVGEVVATPLGVEAMPLLRFRTGDISFLIDAPCECGRETPRLGPVIGRKAQMMKFQGTTIYPPAIFEAAQAVRGAGRCFIEVRAESALSDRIRVCVARLDPALTAERVADELQARLRAKPEVVLLDPDEVERRVWAEGKRKPTTFFDLR